MKNITVTTATETVAKTKILGAELSVSKQRGRHPRCVICGKLEDSNFPGGGGVFIKTATPHEPTAYIHRGCCRWRQYGEGDGLPTDYSGQPIPRAHGKPVGRGLTFTPELECFGPENWPETKMAQFCATYKVQPSEDCTVGCEFHPTTSVNFHGFRESLRGMSTQVDFTREECGMHFNFGWVGITARDVEAIRRAAPTIFAAVEAEMARDPQTTARVWGRAFNRLWAANNHEYVHGSWLNLDSWEHPRIEFRIPHFRDATQLTWATYLAAEMTEFLRDFCREGVSAERTGKRLLRAYKKCAEGRATYQRPERNREI